MISRNSKVWDFKQQIYSLDQFVYQSSTVTNIDELENICSHFVRYQFGAVGYRIASYPYGAQERDEPLVDMAYSKDYNKMNDKDEWVMHYRKKGYHKHDPMMMNNAVKYGLLVYNEVYARSQDPLAPQIHDESKEFGSPGDGMGVDLWAEPGKIISTGLSIPTCDIHTDKLVERMLQTALFIYYATYRELTEFPDISENKQINLTPREKDVLILIARGYTKIEISEVLSISLSSVKRHCENASIKLGTNNMASTVAKAMSWAIISI